MDKSQDAFSAARKTDVDETLDIASRPFVGRWNKLVTTTNWEKGRIIHEWREALIASAPVTEYSDEAWARRVTGVTGPGSTPIDEALSHDSRFLYVLNSGSDTVSAFAVELDGSLTPLGEVPVAATSVGIAAR